MTAPVVRGWCPGAFRPMESGDGWIVRVNPPGGRLSAAQAEGLAEAAAAHGSGWLDITSRASLQIRGVRHDRHPALLDCLAALGLLPPGGRDLPGIMVTPFWNEGDGVQQTAAALAAALERAALPLPGKFGFAIDRDGVLAAASADIRIDLAAGTALVHPDGRAGGDRVPMPAAADAAVALARAYLAQTAGRVRLPRMRDLHLSPDGPGPGGDGRKGAAPPAPRPGPAPRGTLAALAFGQLPAATLARLGPLRLTPWRMLLLEGPVPPDPALITDPGDPLLRVIACPGAPACPQGQAPTRDLARRLAPRVPAGAVLHLSGCAKGCAHPGPADITLTAAGDQWHLARAARAGAPAERVLPAADLDDPDALRL